MKQSHYHASSRAFFRLSSLQCFFSLFTRTFIFPFCYSFFVCFRTYFLSLHALLSLQSWASGCARQGEGFGVYSSFENILILFLLLSSYLPHISLIFPPFLFILFLPFSFFLVSFFFVVPLLFPCN